MLPTTAANAQTDALSLIVTLSPYSHLGSTRVHAEHDESKRGTRRVGRVCKTHQHSIGSVWQRVAASPTQTEAVEPLEPRTDCHVSSAARVKLGATEAARARASQSVSLAVDGSSVYHMTAPGCALMTRVRAP